MNKIAFGVLLIVGTICGATPGLAHYVDPSEEKQHKHTHKQAAIKPAARRVDPWDLLGLALQPASAANSEVQIYVSGGKRMIKSTGLPDHPTGAFPNPGNPNTITEQDYRFSMPLDPKVAETERPVPPNVFGVAINGIPFDPGTAEFWNNDPRSGWHYEAMALGPRLGLDGNQAHVQPNGAYHYHAIPAGLMIRFAFMSYPALLGYAADGFPIYGSFGYREALNPRGGNKTLKSSYRLKAGSRPSNAPPGPYDGQFVEDYEYVQGLGDLDRCNGRFGKTVEYPQGTYYYVLTKDFPYIPRFWKGTPDPSFLKRRPPPPGARRLHRPQHPPGTKLQPPGSGPFSEMEGPWPVGPNNRGPGGYGGPGGPPGSVQMVE